MTEFVNDESVSDDQCHLWDCQHETRDITNFVAIVSCEGVEVPMHVDCAQIYKKAVDRWDRIELCRANARWN